MARELKPISFNPDTKSDKEILDYIDELGVSFGSYVKLLIRKDMRSGVSLNELNDHSEIAEQLKELVSVLKNNNININNDNVKNMENTDGIIESEEERKQRIAMENLMNMGGK
ncbi:hypothetical protein JJB71_16690 [Clostridium perfringens]|uniref:hypothetical protein n=1 Tax=Clostridium perfringens TaxID=1502 RepID=UPI001ABA4279|nr:hypothetical protein [Clostridium perfringens]MBO3399153.1 hypothetical protein [Clostridium perfringens]